MTVTAHLTGLENLLAGAKAEFELERTALLQRAEAAEAAVLLHSGLAAEARSAQAHAERVATKLLTQFALVEHIFSDIKRQATELGYGAAAEASALTAPKTQLPPAPPIAAPPPAQGTIPSDASPAQPVSAESATPAPTTVQAPQ